MIYTYLKRTNNNTRSKNSRVHPCVRLIRSLTKTKDRASEYRKLGTRSVLHVCSLKAAPRKQTRKKPMSYRLAVICKNRIAMVAVYFEIKYYIDFCCYILSICVKWLIYDRVN
jgi:hypothetical protein